VREVEFFVDLSDSLHVPEDRIRIRLKSEKGKLLDKWIAIVRFDCSHGQSFHKDTMFPNGTKEKEVIDVFSLKEFTLYARCDLDLKWKFYKERYFANKRAGL
jgi:hypothetical protein